MSKKLIHISPDTEKKLREKGLKKGYVALSHYVEQILIAHAEEKKSVPAKQLSLKM